MKTNLIPCPVSGGRHSWIVGVCELCGESRRRFDGKMKDARKIYDRDLKRKERREMSM